MMMMMMMMLVLMCLKSDLSAARNSSFIESVELLTVDCWYMYIFPQTLAVPNIPVHPQWPDISIDALLCNGSLLCGLW